MIRISDPFLWCQNRHFEPKFDKEIIMGIDQILIFRYSVLKKILTTP